MNNNKLAALANALEGVLLDDELSRIIYATDASAYREIPLAVAYPKNISDIRELIEFARKEQTSLIPRTAGTSLAGQVVGGGIVVDVSRFFTEILEVNSIEGWVRVQPGVIRDELNMFLKPHGLYFGPETSTANRAMIGGMVGNNSCGSNSIVYGSTREHLLEVKGLLSDGSEVVFGALSPEQLAGKLSASNQSMETQIYKSMLDWLSDEDVRKEIADQFPKQSVPRRNTGYAVDLLADCYPFNEAGDSFNFCKLIAGSEGTLMFITEIKIHCNPLPPKHQVVLALHFHSVHESLLANLIAVQHAPTASELIDKYILERTRDNIEQRNNRFFLEGDPEAILAVELSDDDPEMLQHKADALVMELKSQQLGYHYPLLSGDDVKKIWSLRKAGLGLLSNVPGDDKGVPVIEDTAVDVLDLPDYITELDRVIYERYGIKNVLYAHAGTGELHVRPVINLKTDEGQRLFRSIAEDTAAIVKKYQGSLSGEHGDGRLRGEFIRYMVGEKNYELLRAIKNLWDPYGIFNPGKIVDTPPMDTSLRYDRGHETREITTVFDFSKSMGIVRATEFCNGTGDCRKTELTGGTMCPSYMATRNEKDTTRARANVLREYLTRSSKPNPFDHEEIYEVMDLCLSCKGCKSECPSNVDMARLKAEFLQHYYDANGVPVRSLAIGYISALNRVAAIVPAFYNFLVGSTWSSSVFKRMLGFAQDRSIPKLHAQTLRSWLKKRKPAVKATRRVYLFNDEFTNYNDTPIGQKAVLLLERLGYEVVVPSHVDSGRTFLSKGLVRQAQKLAIKNVAYLADIISAEHPLIGIEPSAILSFRDEYADLVPDDMKERAKLLAANALLFDEFIDREIRAGHISASSFTDERRLIKLHGHCHQKALSSLVPTKRMLSLPQNYEVHLIPSGCCGMAGSFGYEAEHYELSMRVGELILFPSVRKAGADVLIAAPGTSCRHQIKDGTGKEALHPIEILFDALR